MSREFKELPFTNIKAKASGRRRVGIAAVFGNVDEVGDRIILGAFAKTIAEGAPRCKHLWNHSWQHPPVAAIKELRELTRAELPAEVLEKSPEATGGLLVDRDYFKKSDLAEWILEAIDADEINEMSFAYDTILSTTITEPIPGSLEPEKTRNVRELRELKLYDTSDVLYGCNSATIAAGAKSLAMMPLGAIASQLVLLNEELKAGRRNSDSDQKLVDLIHSTAVSLGAECTESMSDDDPEKGKAGAAESTSLDPSWFDHAGIQLANLEN